MRSPEDIAELKKSQIVEVCQQIVDEGLVHTSLVIKVRSWCENDVGI